jgi:hypothetical protein
MEDDINPKIDLCPASGFRSGTRSPASQDQAGPRHPQAEASNMSFLFLPSGAGLAPESMEDAHLSQEQIEPRTAGGWVWTKMRGSQDVAGIRQAKDNTGISDKVGPAQRTSTFQWGAHQLQSSRQSQGMVSQNLLEPSGVVE